MDKIKYIILIISLCLPVLLKSQSGQIIVTGNLTSETTGEELIGVQVVELDKNARYVSSTVTDFSGNFSLQIKSTENNLRFSYVGYDMISLPIKDRRRFNLKMKDNTTIEEVVVQGRRLHSDGALTIPQREISGAIQRISTKEFEGLSVASIDDALQGRIAGLDIVSNSGNLGSGSSMRIRGITSINSNSEPLIVLNDVPYENNVDKSFDYSSANQEQFANLLNINPNDIEEITVLKDGASAAIWGAKGANGVILIKTKKGVKGPTRVQYTYMFSGHKQPKGMKMLNGDAYTMLMKQAYFNPNQDENAANIPEFNYDPTFSEYENFNNNTDWVDEVTKYGFTHDQTVTISGGGDKATFRASLGYLTQTGTVLGQQLERISNRMNLEYQVSDRIKFITDFSFTYSDNDRNYEFEDGDSGKNFDNILDIAYKKMPNVSIYQQDVNGRNTNVYYNIPQSSGLDASQKDLMNPVALANLASFKEKDVRIIPTFRLQYDILDPNKTRLRYLGWVSFDFDNRKYNKFLPKEVTSKEWSNQLVNRSYGHETEGLSVSMDHNLTYIPQLGDDHSLMAYVSYQLSTGKSRAQKFEKHGLPAGITDPMTGGSSIKYESNEGEWRSMAILGKIHYMFKNRYILDLTLRRDGSTRFGPNNRWGTFPAISGKWIISEEPFMEPTRSWLSELAIRPGWGVTGNMPDSEYLYYSRYNGSWSEGGNYLDISTIKPVTVKLANLKWERSTSYNLGADLHLFDYRYSLDFNVYKRRTEDLLFKDRQIPSSTGFPTLSYMNGGIVDNTGWELNVSTNKMLKLGDWTVDVNFNLSNSKNEIIELDSRVLNGFNTSFNYDNGSYLSRIQVGNSFGSIYGFRYKGVYQYDEYVAGSQESAPVARDADGNVVYESDGKALPMYFDYGGKNYRFRGGDAIYEDVNNDGTIDELDIVYLGNSNPKLTGGFGTTIRYKNFSVNAFFNFRSGFKIVNRARMNAENMYTNDNQSTAVKWRWRKDGDDTGIPRALYQSGYNWLGSDRFVEDGSFLRLKTLTFSYSFDTKVIRPWYMSQLNLYLTLNNLLTFTKYSGVDPEVSPNSISESLMGVCVDNNKTPRSQYFTLGITVGF